MFDWSDFMQLLDPLTLVLVVVIGCGMGLAMGASEHVVRRTHAYWMLSGGLVFFVPVAIAHFYHGVALWEHILADGVLWVFYVLGLYLGSQVNPTKWIQSRRPARVARRRRGTSRGSDQPHDEGTGQAPHR